MKPSDCPCGSTFTSYRARKAHRAVCGWQPIVKSRTVNTALQAAQVLAAMPPVQSVEVVSPLISMVEPSHEEAARTARMLLDASRQLRRVGPGVYVKKKDDH